jgi:hypothetical protein
MPKNLEQIVQSMLDAGEKEDDIASVIKEYHNPVEPGNLNLVKQPRVKNPDGTTSTVDSKSYGIDGQEVLLPSVTQDGRHLTKDEDILEEYKKTGKHLGKFRSPEGATKYATQLHDDYAAGKYDEPKAPSTFGSGVLDSLNPFGGAEALKASGSGLLGYLKGAVTDIPSTIGSAVSSVADAVSDPGKFVRQTRDVLSSPLETARGVAGETSDMFSQAGSHPEEFGRTMGQLTGQPLVTAGMLEGAPQGVFGSKPIPSGLTAAKPFVGQALEAGGNLMAKHAPISGMIPKIAEPRILRTVERAAGRKIADFGKEMQVKVKNGEVVLPEVKDGEFSVNDKTKKLGPATSIQQPGRTGPQLRLGGNDIATGIDSRISGLPPEEPPLRKVISPTVNRLNDASANSNFFDKLKLEANRYGMSVDDYIKSLRKNGGDNFVMPSAEKPRVRTSTILK